MFDFHERLVEQLQGAIKESNWNLIFYDGNWRERQPKQKEEEIGNYLHANRSLSNSLVHLCSEKVDGYKIQLISTNKITISPSGIQTNWCLKIKKSFSACKMPTIQVAEILFFFGDLL